MRPRFRFEAKRTIRGLPGTAPESEDLSIGDEFPGFNRGASWDSTINFTMLDERVFPSSGGAPWEEPDFDYERTPLRKWQETQGVDRNLQINLVRLAHVCYQHPDLDELTRFMEDFGMQVAKRAEDRVWFKGYGHHQYLYDAKRGEEKFLGGTFEVQSLNDLILAERFLPFKKTSIQELRDSPGGGLIITIYDPLGFPINLMFGQQQVQEVSRPQQCRQPRKVLALDHYGLCVENFRDQVDWYTKIFNLAPSTILYTRDPKHEPVRTECVLFARIDQNIVDQNIIDRNFIDKDFVEQISIQQNVTDHHSFVLASRSAFTDDKEDLGCILHEHHCSFEVYGDIEDPKKKYKSLWGLVRSATGSGKVDRGWLEVPDYVVEHFAVTYAVSKASPVRMREVRWPHLPIWGPKVPEGDSDEVDSTRQ